ncbi:MAG: putative lipid II flippase FtsW [Patescibacteria group bacterium]|nr:putative lipid II flippase FtsW [Patescibacteria group bacterium]
MPFFKKKINTTARQNEYDRGLIFVILAIVVFGLIELLSASGVVAYAKFGDAYYYFKHQLFGLSLGAVAFLYLARVDYHYWRKYALGFLIFSILLLLLVFIPGISADYGKARSWINIFGYSLQPSEFVKLSFLVYLAAWLENRKENLKDFSQGIGPFIIILGIITFLMLLQPDIGTLSIVAITSLIVYFVGGGSYKHIIFIILFGSLALALMVHMKPYQMDRFKCLFDPETNKQDVCYQVNQSLIAVGSGGIIGRGLGDSRQKYMYLPEVSGDSIFAVIAEETGFVFSVFLVLGYLYIFYRGYKISLYAPDDFGKILAIGISSWVALQVIINIGGITNILPMTGVPLPLVSYGGSAILTVLAALGILVNISKQINIK